MVKIIIGGLLLLALCGCDGTVSVSTLDSTGAPVEKTTVAFMDTSGKKIVAQGVSGVDGSLKVIVPYGDYKIKASKTGFAGSEGYIHIDLIAGFFGSRADLSLSKQ